MPSQLALELPDNQTWMHIDALREQQNLLLGEVRLYSIDEILQLVRRYTEIRPGRVGQNLAFRQALPVIADLDIDDRFAHFPVFSQYVFDLMAKNEPEIVDAIEP